MPRDPRQRDLFGAFTEVMVPAPRPTGTRRRSTASGELARDVAIDKVERHAPADWLRRTYRLIEDMTRGRTFTTDDLWAALGPDVPHEPRAMGAVIRDARLRALITPTGAYKKSSRPECHARPILVWMRM